MEQIQFLLGHASVLTTERYLGCKQNLEEPVNDRFGCLFSKTLDSREGLELPVDHLPSESSASVNNNASKNDPFSSCNQYQLITDPSRVV